MTKAGCQRAKSRPSLTCSGAKRRLSLCFRAGPQRPCRPIWPGHAQGPVGAFYPHFDPALVGWLWSRRCGAPRSSASDSKDESAYRHADCCKDARDRYPLFAEESSNSLSQRLIFMEEPPDGLTNSVDLRPESCCICGEGFEPRLPFKLIVGELAL